ncbi:hypothetical protein L1994_10435 [Methanomicrobium antiquum]|uniref:Response receiver domain-containing protein n=1 Tax=Methanomicrobium antiquum TaxID=487686 RepID=A0AAF0FWY3_9EURY|nr:hypothetical protein [Methanomicrobium antiquum]WFN36544.1 hypothetical protein L1994_10435 [Methanomicrobium antiquum]
MTATALLNGIAVIIDDHIDDKSCADPILDIKNQIEKKHIPVLGYSELPDDDQIKHFSNAAFVIIDWDLKSTEEMPMAVTPGSALQESKEESVASFIIKLKDYYFGPVFIFSNQSEKSIEDKLKEVFQNTGGTSQCKDFMDYISVKKKNELQDNRLFDEINKWFKDKPSIYVIKKWDESLNKSKRNLFWHLYELNHNWPRIFWRAFKDDSTDPSVELRDLLSRNLVSRLETCEFEEESIGEIVDKIDHNDIRKVMCGEKFIDSSLLDIKTVTCGDVFHQKENDIDYYYVNIRPACDCIPRDGENGVDSVNMYLIRGTRLTDAQIKSSYLKKYHKFDENAVFTILSFISHGNENITIKMHFNDFFVKTYGDFKDYRVGRLLPPHITHIKQKYAAYLQREGFIPTPECAIPIESKK